MTKFSTNALTARYCAMRGWKADTVQSWRGTQRHDLFFLFDTVALIDGRMVFVQNCSSGTLRAHREKFWQDVSFIRKIQKAGVEVELWEWKRKKTDGKLGWFLRTERFGDDNPGPWEGPFDLYPKKSKSEDEHVRAED